MNASRRRWLGGAAVAMALPWLESLRPRPARAAGHDVPTRLLCYYLPNGIVMSSWRTAAGELVLSPTLSPLAGLESKLLVVDGLANAPAVRTDGPAGHETGTTGMLTAASIERAEDHVRAAVSMDQLYAAAVGTGSSRPSLQLGLERSDPFGACPNGFACAYSRSISWLTPTTPLPPVIDPAVVFALLFAGFDPGQSAAAQARRAALRSSVLDAVHDESTALARELSSADRHKLAEYQDGVRALELRIAAGAPACDDVDADGFRTAPRDVPEHVALMHALMVMALRCDVTRVISFMLGNSASNRGFGFIGVPDGHHDLSHHAGDTAKIERLQQIERWELEQFAALLRALDEVDDGDGTLLDHCVVLLSSELASGNLHGHEDLPLLLAGGTQPWFRPGRTLATGGAPLGSLHLALLRGLGLSIDRFGDDGEAPLPELG